MRKDRVYTLTFHEVLNVGAVLQAYALQKFIIDSGYESEIINYRPRYFLWQIYRPAKGVRRSIDKLRNVLKFSKFRRDNLNISRRKIHNIRGLNSFNDCVAIVCGSDQIWNKHLTGGDYDPVFFLSGRMQPRKIAYAASSGGRSLRPGRAVVEPYLKGFHSIGTREDFLRRDIIESGMVAEAEVVLDPTFLISDYGAVIDDSLVPAGLRYIASYEVSDAPSRAHFSERIRAIKEKLGLPVIHLGAKPIEHADKAFSNLSPGEWLGLISNAYVVCTNSFHGVALSLNLHRGLVFIPHVDDEKNARALGLLEYVGLSHLVDDAETFEPTRHIDYSVENVAEAVESSKMFLLSSLR